MTMLASQITSLTVVYSIVYSGVNQRKHQSSASLALGGKFTWDRWISRTNGQLRGKCFHLMTSSWSSQLLSLLTWQRYNNFINLSKPIETCISELGHHWIITVCRLLTFGFSSQRTNKTEGAMASLCVGAKMQITIILHYLTSLKIIFK